MSDDDDSGKRDKRVHRVFQSRKKRGQRKLSRCGSKRSSVKTSLAVPTTRKTRTEVVTTSPFRERIDRKA